MDMHACVLTLHLCQVRPVMIIRCMPQMYVDNKTYYL
jgi:hypothetical protein